MLKHCTHPIRSETSHHGLVEAKMDATIEPADVVHLLSASILSFSSSAMSINSPFWIFCTSLDRITGRPSPTMNGGGGCFFVGGGPVSLSSSSWVSSSVPIIGRFTFASDMSPSSPVYRGINCVFVLTTSHWCWVCFFFWNYGIYFDNSCYPSMHEWHLPSRYMLPTLPFDHCKIMTPPPGFGLAYSPPFLYSSEQSCWDLLLTFFFFFFQHLSQSR